ncbi:MAG: hypothetical protein U9O98_03070 [Asgard group archaeon]|nr:hypothetical protein [Asgard group archaeon]
MKIEIPREWYLVICGINNWRKDLEDLSRKEFLAAKEVIDDFLTKIFFKLRKQGAMVFSLFWSQENLAPTFLLSATRTNNQFIKKLQAIFDDVLLEINQVLTPSERNSSWGKKLLESSLEGQFLVLKCFLPHASFGPYSSIENILKGFSDAHNSEFLTVKRAAHDFKGRKNWLSTLEAITSREFLKPVGPIRNIKEAKEVMTKRNYEKTAPGDFEKIMRYLTDAVPYRSTLFELETAPNQIPEDEVIGHLIIQYLSTKGDIPLKLHKRSVTYQRLGRKIELINWAKTENFDYKELDHLILLTQQLVYEKIERKIIDVGGIKLDRFWTQSDIGNSIYFLPKFTFTEDTLETLQEILSLPRELLEPIAGIRTTELVDIWRKAGLEFNLLIFEVIRDEVNQTKKLNKWIRQIKNKVEIGPQYIGATETLEERYYRPF